MRDNDPIGARAMHAPNSAFRGPKFRPTLAMRVNGSALLGVLLIVISSVAGAWGVSDRPQDDEVVMIRKAGFLIDAELETTIFRPEGQGPFPLVVINHGKDPGNPRFQGRARFAVASRALVQRGFVVMLPMRQGFSKSSGGYVAGGCFIEGNGQGQADDVVAVLDYARTLPYVDGSRIIVMGQSHGGFTTLALGTRPYPGVLGLVNFAGGLRNDQCNGWESNLVDTFATYGAKAQYPSLWFYGDNDAYWPPSLYHRMYEAYNKASGGKADLVAYGTFGTDSHKMFGAQEGLAIWINRFDAFYLSLLTPSQRVEYETRLASLASRSEAAANR